MANFSCKTLTLAAGLVLSVMSANAQQMRKGYVDFGKNASSEYFHNLLKDWAPGKQVARKALSSTLATWLTYTLLRQASTCLM